MVKCSCYLDIVEGILVHGVGRPLSVQFEHNHPTVMPYTMGQIIQMNERYMYDFTVENP